MDEFKDLRIVDNFYQTSSFFPMPTVLVGTVSENGMTNLGSYSLCFPYYIAGKERYAMLLECRNNSNTAQNILRSKKVSLNFIPDKRKFFREAVRLGFPGMTTEEIDQIVYNETTRLGGIPAPLNYEGFPKSVCTSINDQVCHGIPSEKIVLRDGDIINVDVSTIYHGYFSDSSRMFCIGEVSDNAANLVKVTKECVELGLKEVKPWGFLGDIAQAVSDHAHKNGYTVVREIGGHGIGLEFHEDPWVGYVGKRGTDMLLVPGMVFTIEPMVNEGSYHVKMDEDGQDWVVITSDGKLSAQWEITVAVTEDGYEVLTY